MEYALTDESEGAYSCSSFIACEAANVYTKFVAFPEEIKFKTTKNVRGSVDGKYRTDIEVKGMDTKAHTPGSVYRAAVNSGGQVIKGIKKSGGGFFSEGSYKHPHGLMIPFVEKLSHYQIKSEAEIPAVAYEAEDAIKEEANEEANEE